MRSALARLAGAPEDAPRAAPGDPELDSAPPARVVLLGLSGDFEVELEFAHRTAPRLPDARWLLVAERSEVDRARRLFDGLDAEVLPFAPDPRLLRERIRAPGSPAAEPLPLSQRPARDALRERFTRWFADLDLPELLRAVSPRLAGVPLLVLGEPGTGRALLARYVHAFGGAGGGSLVHVPCAAGGTRADLLEAMAPVRGAVSSRGGTLLLEGPERLGAPLQRELLGWIEYGLPAGVAPAAPLRWIGTALRDGPGADLDPDLARALAGLRIEIPPLRERRRAVAALANDTARHWCARRGLPPMRIGEDAVLVLEEYPWPGNLRELEATVEQSLAAGAGDPVRAADLVLDGAPFAPLGSGWVPAPAEEEIPAEEALPVQEPPERELPEQEAAPEQELPEEELPEEEPKPFAVSAPTAGGEPKPSEDALDRPLQRLAGALAHEVRNPLTAIRSFAALLPERYGDSEFRGRFAELVGEGVDRIEDVVDRLERLASLAPPRPSEVDVGALLGELLRERRDAIRRRRLLVLKELDSDRPWAVADPEQLRFAFEALLNQALDLVPERGDLYCASRHHPSGLRGGPSLRVLLRTRAGGTGLTPPPVGGLAPAENALEFVIAEAVIKAQGGSFALDAGEAESVVVVDLPAP